MQPIKRFQVQQMIDTYVSRDIGKKIRVVRLNYRPDCEGGGNYGIYDARFEIDDESIDGIAKFKQSSNLFDCVNAISKLNIGAIYYGWADNETLPQSFTPQSPFANVCSLMSIVEGVDWFDERFTGYFTDRSLWRFYQVYSVLIRSGVVLNDINFFLSSEGNVNFFDYDVLVYKPIGRWNKSDYLDSKSFIDSHKKHLTNALDESWKNPLNLMCNSLHHLLSLNRARYGYIDVF